MNALQIVGIVLLAFGCVGLLYCWAAMAFNRYGFRKYVNEISNPWKEAVKRLDWEAIEFYKSECSRFDEWWKPFNPAKWLQWNKKFGVRPMTLWSEAHMRAAHGNLRTEAERLVRSRWEFLFPGMKPEDYPHVFSSDVENKLEELQGGAAAEIDEVN